MDDAFKPQSLSIGELFGNKDSLYKIPQYQRPYKWGTDQVEKLWEDIWEAFENGDKNYFLGSVITANSPEGESSAYADVVDGQQRITTLMILFCVLRDLYPEINIDNIEHNPSAVDAETIKSSIAVHGRTNRLKLFTHRQHHTDFEQLILNGNTLHIKQPFKYQLQADEEPKFKFENTAAIFCQKLKTIGQTETEKFVNFLFNQVQIIRIDCKDRDFAIKLFQVLNDRGLDLTAADLIKSFLIEKLHTKYKDSTDTLKLKEEQFIADWREMENNIKDCDINLNELFILYEYYLLAQNPRKSLSEELQAQFKFEDPNVVVAKLKKASELYSAEIYEKLDSKIYSLWYLRWSMYWKSICLTALIEEYDNYEKLIVELRRFYYLYWIAGYTLTSVKQISFNLIKWIKEKHSIEKISLALRTKLANDDVVEKAKSNLAAEHVTTEPWIKPLLLTLEYNIPDDSVEPSYIHLDSQLHLEHILPTKYKTVQGWEHFDQKTASAWINTVGNITLLSGKKNIEASNNPFEQKINVYKGKGKYRNKDDKVTAFRMSEQIVTDYNLNKFEKSWNIDALTDRWNWFFNEVGIVLEIDTTDLIKKYSPEL